jgi:hypothetical protein
VLVPHTIRYLEGVPYGNEARAHVIPFGRPWKKPPPVRRTVATDDVVVEATATASSVSHGLFYSRTSTLRSLSNADRDFIDERFKAAPHYRQ